MDDPMGVGVQGNEEIRQEEEPQHGDDQEMEAEADEFNIVPPANRNAGAVVPLAVNDREAPGPWVADGALLRRNDIDDPMSDDDLDDFSDTSTYSSDESDSDGWSSPPDKIDTKVLRQYFHRCTQAKGCINRPLFCFKPFSLMRLNYKIHNQNIIYPSSRSGHRVVASESDLYCLGGYNPHTPLTPAQRQHSELFLELWKYNFASNTWKLILDSEKCPNMPRELASNALILYRNVLVSHGGTGFPFGESCSNDCYVYSVDKEKPSVIPLPATGDLPLAQYGPGIAIHDDYLYTIGGTTGYEYSCDVYRMSLATRVWENVYICRPEMRDDPAGRYRHEVVYDGQYIFVLGGGTSTVVFDLQRIPAFNLKTNCWEHIETLPDRSVMIESTTGDADATANGYPKARKCFSCVQHKQANGDIEAFITGGLQGDLTTYFNDIWRLNLRSMQWTLIRTAALPKPLYFHSAAHAGNGCMYIFGGIQYSEKYTNRRNDLFKMWLTVPKLSEMCWDAVTYYNSQLNYRSRSELVTAGIPSKFLDRLAFVKRKKAKLPELLSGLEYRKRHRVSV